MEVYFHCQIFINQKRLDYLEKTVKLIDIANRIDERLQGDDAKEIFIKVLQDKIFIKVLKKRELISYI